MVSLNDVRSRARNTVRISTIRNYITAFDMARDLNEEYPDPGHTSWRCLGDYSDNRCWRSDTGVAEDATLNNI